MTLRLAIALGLAAALLCASAPAQAANIVTNPEFSDCTPGPVPTGWEAYSMSGAACNNMGNPAGDTASMLVTGGLGIPGARTFCIDVSIPAGNHSASFAFNATAIVASVSFYAVLYSMTGCTSALGAQPPPLQDLTVTPNTWEVVNGAMNAASPAQSVQFLLEYTCTAVCIINTQRARFDDVSFESSVATPVTLRGFSATRTAKGVAVRWRTASELDVLGFHVYRQVNGRRVHVSSRLIPARGRGAYSFLDRGAPRGKTVRYWVQAVNLDGSRTWHGPART